MAEVDHQKALDLATKEARCEIDRLYPKDTEYWQAYRQKELPKLIQKKYLERASL